MAKIKDKFTLLGDLIKEIRDVKTRLTKLVKFKGSEEFYDLNEVKRVLKKGGHFITEQVGAGNAENLSRFFCPNFTREDVLFNLENQVPLFETAGFKVVYKNQLILYFHLYISTLLFLLEHLFRP